MGYHRDSFYEIRRAFQVGGVAALVEEKRGPRGPHPNRVSPGVEQRILDYALAMPTHGANRVANELRLEGQSVSPSGVRGVWLRHELETRTKRLLRLEREAQGETFACTSMTTSLSSPSNILKMITAVFSSRWPAPAPWRRCRKGRWP